MSLDGKLCRLRAVEPADVDAMYLWENDIDIWRVSNTVAPYSRYALEQLVETMRYDIYASRQLRLIIETSGQRLDDAGDFGMHGNADGSEYVTPGDFAAGVAVGAVDIFEFDPLNLRAGIGILVYDEASRGCGYASDALRTVERYACEVLHLHQLWSNVAADNERSLVLFESAGYRRVGIKEEWIRRRDGYVGEIMFQKIL